MCINTYHNNFKLKLVNFLLNFSHNRVKMFFMLFLYAQIWSNIFNDRWNQPGADPGFQVRGALKKIAPSEKIVGISCEKSRFYAKKS